MSRWIAIVDGDAGRLANVMSEDDWECHAREMGDLCGGCKSCLLQQAEHYGYKILRDLDDSDLAEVEVELSDSDLPEELAKPGGGRVEVGVDVSRDGDRTAVTVVKARKGIAGAKAELIVIDDVIATNITPYEVSKKRLAIDSVKAAIAKGEVFGGTFREGDFAALFGVPK